jgi:processive 1,2-diacylglycerol beta-glucosyltransferase
MKKRVLIAFAVPGSGHSQAAAAIADALGLYAERVHVRQHHLLLSWPRVGRIFPWLYKFFIRYLPRVWRFGHGNRSLAPFVRWYVRQSIRFDWLGIMRVVRQWNPHAIVVTHFYPLQILGEAKRLGLLNVPLFAVPTDFGAHPYWAHPSIDRYFVAAEATADDLRAAGVADRKIEISGIPVKAEFLSQPDKLNAQRALGLDASRPIALVMGGSYGFFPYLTCIRLIAAQKAWQRTQWLFLFGKDERLLQRAYSLVPPELARSIHLFGFQKSLVPFMAAADFAISKAGGLTSSESLVAGLPLIIYKPLPGQEEMNKRVLVSRGAAVSATSAEHAVRVAASLGDDPVRLSALRRAALDLGRPGAAARVAEVVLLSIGVKKIDQG